METYKIDVVNVLLAVEFLSIAVSLYVGLASPEGVNTFQVLERSAFQFSKQVFKAWVDSG